jgi:hypothetical protein
MDARFWWRRLRRPHRATGVKAFDRELARAGGLAACADAGVRTVPVRQVVGSVGRWRELGPDFFPRSRRAPTERYESIARAMRKGAPLPVLELYRLTVLTEAGELPPTGEYYIVDGHSRVAMARRLGQDFVDAHIIAYTVAPRAGRDAAMAPVGSTGKTGARSEPTS